LDRSNKDRPSARFNYLAIALLSFAVFLYAVFGMQWAALAILICAVMAWSWPFEINEAKGKPLIGTTGRIVVASIMGTIALLLIATHSGGEPAPTTSRNADLAPTDVGKSSKIETPKTKAKLTPEEAKRKVQDLLAGEKQMKREDVEGRLIFWDEIVALAPDNAEFATQRSNIKSEVDALAPYREQPHLGGVITKYKGRKEGFGNVLVIDITVRNRSRANLVDFEITCETVGASGTVIGRSSKVLFEMVEGRSEKSFRGINMGLIDPQSKRSNCQIERALIG
jgi:hypothetical protein